MPFDDAAACRWAEHHVATWNGHDLDEILALYRKDAELESPLAVNLVGSPRVEGFEALRAYFGAALERYPELRFELLDVLAGVGSVTLYFESIGGRSVAEVCFVDDDGRIARVLAHYTAMGMTRSRR